MAATADRSTLTLEGADQVMAAAMAFAAEQGWAATVCVSDGAGVPLLVRRSDGAWPASVDIAIGKAATAIRFGKPSGALEDMINGGRTAFVGTAGGTPLRGGVPISVGGAVVGSVGVSGLTPDKDEQVALAGAAALG
ncbi:MAG: heme-binding protein [Rhodospirillaceae bacterium]|nr:heme-binding protein [Rhodospirillaceae bacterium]